MNAVILRGTIRSSVVIASALYLGGCSEYLDRRDTLRQSAGEAVQNNVIVHSIDPWPRHAFIVPRTTSGERTQRAVERYRNPGAGSGSAQTPTTVIRSGDVAQPRIY